jgi:hypothetical protein
MVTNRAEEIARQPMSAARASGPGVVARALAAVQHAFCSLRGHDNLLHFDHNRMFLRCATCGYETPGWQIDRTRPRLRFHGDPRRQILVGPGNLVSTRKIA